MSVRMCPFCTNDDPRLIEALPAQRWLCTVCSKTWNVDDD